jgi:hypothetical protein
LCNKRAIAVRSPQKNADSTGLHGKMQAFDIVGVTLRLV